DRRIKADSHIESENMHISTAHLVGRLKTTAIQHKSLNLGSSYFGSRMKAGAAVWQSWFDAIWMYGDGTERGAAVMYPPCDGDSYASYSADPPENHTWLRIWYQY
ncbi:MAG: hypothetical protein UMU76_05565, partial [Prosthecochloris sp.]|nr:hypothetical protein [Prosthecochloris sp.]